MRSRFHARRFAECQNAYRIKRSSFIFFFLFRKIFESGSSTAFCCLTLFESFFFPLRARVLFVAIRDAMRAAASGISVVYLHRHGAAAAAHTGGTRGVETIVGSLASTKRTCHGTKPARAHHSPELSSVYYLSRDRLIRNARR